ncbi:LysR family transcriptional regulator [Acerihabitans sp. TG2]|uniref:LysR family transcriptional regulator n=1 Tax=Acerihabitans sp. TG2 TaxID=3096008 RepID=UPI002B230C68|nr:LysR family transcriptional regulator [Acerihabitans sp. TG2]MEA9390510.1 LysR family transcriptional regulator [Acerihabitans sp. TG2]
MILLSKTLRYFIVTAQEQSIRLAALILCITPSPLCRTIKLFEISLGHKLFTRTSSGLKLTDYGRELYDTLLPLYAEVSSLEKRLINKPPDYKRPVNKLKIGIDHHDYAYLSPILSSSFFKNSEENISLEYFSPNEVNITDALKNGICQIFFSSKHIECGPEVFHIALPTDTMMLAVKRDSFTQFASQTEALSGKVLVQYEQYEQYHNNAESLEIEKYLSSNKVNIKRINIPELYVQLAMIEKGDAVGLMPSSVNSIISERNYQIKLIPFLCGHKYLTIERNVYFMNNSQKFIENNILPMIAKKTESLAG